MNNLIPLEEQYGPEFVKLHNGFARKNSALNKMICTRGPAYLGFFTAVMDRMGDYSKTDFTLTFEELVEEMQNYFALYTTPREDLVKIISEYIDAGIFEKRVFVNRYTDIEEVRYCIPLTQDDLLDSRSQWYGKIAAPMKESNPEKKKLTDYIEREKEIHRQISKKNAAKRTYREQLNQELAKTDCDRKAAQVLNGLIEDCEKDISALYRKLHSQPVQTSSSQQGGDLNDVGE